MSKSKRKMKLPKRVAGVKVPKRVRKSSLAKLLASPGGRALAIEVLAATGAAAGGLLVKKKADHDPKLREALAHPVDSLKAAGQHLVDGGTDAAAGASAMSSQLAYAIGEAARTFAEAMQGPRDAGTVETRPARRRVAASGESALGAGA